MDAIRDENRVPVWMATSYLDGTTLVPIKIDSVTRGIQIDTSHTIGFSPTKIAGRDNNHVHVLMGASSVDGTPFPVLADPVTGAILIDSA